MRRGWITGLAAMGLATGVMAQEAAFVGTVRADDMQGLSFEAGGCIARISEGAKREGHAMAGEVLVELDGLRTDLALQSAKARVMDLEAAVEERALSVSAAQADVERRAQELDFAKREFERNDALFRRGLINESTIEAAERSELDAQFAADRANEALASARSAQRRAEIALEIGKLDLQGAEIDMDKLTVTAPFEGVLIGFEANVGDCVQSGALAAQIYDPAQKAVDIYVLISQLAEPGAEGVSTGAPMQITRVNGAECGGRVTRVESEVNLETQYVKATVTVDDACSEGLFLNEAVEVSVLPRAEAG